MFSNNHCIGMNMNVMIVAIILKRQMTIQIIIPIIAISTAIKGKKKNPESIPWKCAC